MIVKKIVGVVAASMPEGQSADVKASVPASKGVKGLEKQALKQEGLDGTYEAKVRVWWEEDPR